MSNDRDEVLKVQVIFNKEFKKIKNFLKMNMSNFLIDKMLKFGNTQKATCSTGDMSVFPNFIILLEKPRFFHMGPPCSEASLVSAPRTWAVGLGP